MSLRDSILYDSLFQSVVLSPLAGLVVGAVCAWLFPSRTTSPESPQQIIINIKEEVHHHYHGTRQRDPSAAPGVVLVLSFVATWLFVRHLETITYIFWLGLGFVAGAILGFFGTVLLRRGLNGEWVLELVFALGSLGMCSWLVSLPWKGIDQSLIDLANEADSVSQFYQSLTPWGVRLVNSQMAGMWLVAANAYVILLRGLHILSLAMADPRKSYGLSARIALATRHAGGLRGMALILFAGWLAWYMLLAAQNPDAFIWRIVGSGGM